MSCACNCNPCHCEEECDPANEPLSSALNNFIEAFFGSLTKSCVDGQVVWVLPCNLDSGFAGYPRIAGEGLACYFLRVFETISASTLIRVTDFDTSPNNLEPKVAAGTGVSLQVLNPGGDEQLEVSSTGLVAVTAADTTLDFLSPKLSAGNEISLAVLNPGANEQVQINYLLPASVLIAASNINWALSNGFFKTLGANTVFTFTNDQDCKTIIVAITNTAGNFTATWPVAVQWTNGSEPVLTLGAKTDVFTFVKINSIIYGNVVPNMS